MLIVGLAIGFIVGMLAGAAIGFAASEDVEKMKPERPPLPGFVERYMR